jgi:putative phage-type endonuclease
MIQGSKEWLAWRNEGLGGSDAPIIMGDSPWTTPYQLWERKLGLAPDQTQTFRMTRGIDMEPIARAAYESLTGEIVEPICVTHPVFEWMRVSLDGMPLGGGIPLEIKCPGAADHAEAVAGRVPGKYKAQLQHAMACTQAPKMHYFSYDGENGVLVVVDRDDAYIAQMIETEQAFWQCVCTKTPPAGAPRDDEAWMTAAKAYRAAKVASDEAEATLKAAKEVLVELGGGYGGGVKCTATPVKGAVDYAGIPELLTVDLEPYRKKGRTDWRVTVDKDKT